MVDFDQKNEVARAPGRVGQADVGSREASLIQRLEGLLLPSSRQELEGDPRQRTQKVEQASRVRDQQEVEQLRIDSLRSAQLTTQQRSAPQTPHENILKRNISRDRA